MVDLGDYSYEDFEDFRRELEARVIANEDQRDEFARRAFAAAKEICTALPDPPLATRSTSTLPATSSTLTMEEMLDQVVAGIIAEDAFQALDSFDVPEDVKDRVLQVAGEELCPEHHDQIGEYLEGEPP